MSSSLWTDLIASLFAFTVFKPQQGHCSNAVNISTLVHTLVFPLLQAGQTGFFSSAMAAICQAKYLSVSV